jgi:hypothetical protein
MPFAFLMTEYMRRLEQGDPVVTRKHNIMKAFFRRLLWWKK